MLFVGIRFLNVSNRVIQYGNEAVLPFYILHYPVLVITTFCVMQLDSDTITTFLIVSTASFIATLTLFELLIRRINVMRWLLGMKPRKPVVHRDVERSFSS